MCISVMAEVLNTDTQSHTFILAYCQITSETTRVQIEKHKRKT